MSYTIAHKKLHALKNIKQSESAKIFFKTGKGEYGEGDQFLGINVPTVRKLAKEFTEISLEDCSRLLSSPYNEERSMGLYILVDQYDQGDEKKRKEVYELYLKNRKYVNNWNLVDCSAHEIVGKHLYEKNRAPLYDLVKSNVLWDKRIAIVGTLYFIRKNDFADTVKISKLLLNDTHDLMHKACGWMLREVGKRDVEVLKKFLEENRHKMPRTMLRYAIEKFPEKQRKAYLAKS